MNEVDRYIREVLAYIHLPAGDEKRIEADLRAHFEEALAAGDSAEAVIARMGQPKEVAAEFMAQARLRYAGFWRRLVAFLVDLAIIIPVVGVLSVLGIVLANLVPRGPQGADYVIGAILIALVVAIGGVVVGILLLYFPILEGRFGQTVGKRLLGLRVLKEDGLPMGYKEAFLRRLSFYFDFLVIDALFIPFTEKKQRAFDIIARTVVVRDAS